MLETKLLEKATLLSLLWNCSANANNKIKNFLLQFNTSSSWSRVGARDSKMFGIRDAVLGVVRNYIEIPDDLGETLAGFKSGRVVLHDVAIKPEVNTKNTFAVSDTYIAGICGR